MESVLITGASGFIGSFLVEEGIRRKYRVYAGIRSSSSLRYLSDPGIRFLTFDFSTVDRIVKTLETCKHENIRFHYIIHNAGITKSQRKEDYYRINFLNTKNFLEALRQTGMIPEKFIFISSLAAYGPGNPVTMEPILLSDEPHPIGLYGRSKLEAERYIMSQDKVPWLVFRPTGVYGPREKDYYVFFKTISRGLETYIGSARQMLTFVYVKDLVRLVFDAAVSPVVRRGYFVTDGREYDTDTFAALTKKILGKRTVVIRVPSGIVKRLAWMLEMTFGLWGAIPTLNTDKYKILSGRNWKCETRPLETDFGFRAEYDLEKGLQETLEWYKKEGWL